MHPPPVLTCVSLLADEANGIFQVLTEQYRATPTPHCGKLLALDEAHKFMDGSSSSDGLSEAIVNVARLMRHDGMRLAVSTQSPNALAPADSVQSTSAHNNVAPWSPNVFELHIRPRITADRGSTRLNAAGSAGHTA